MTDLPPYAQLLRVRVDPGGDPLRLVMPYGDDVVGRPGFLHGGAISGLLELAAYATLRAELGDAEVKMKPVSMSIDFLRGGTDRDTYAAATIRRLGKRVANVEALAWQEIEAKPIAAARMTLLLG